MKEYYHEQSEEDIKEFIIEYGTRNYKYYFNKPPWCGNNLALDAAFFCISLVEHKIKGFCDCCKCLHLIEGENCDDCEEIDNGSI